jgi:hypothetical protein
MLVRNPQAPRGLFDGIVFDGSLAGVHRAGTYFHDASGLANHGTLTNMDPATDWVWSSVLGRWALDLDGDNDYLNVPASSTLDSDVPALTLATWVFPRSIKTYGHLGGRWGRYAIRMRTFSGTTGLTGFVWDSGATSVAAEANISNVPTNQWTHLALVADPSVKLYANGILIGTGGELTSRATGAMAMVCGSYPAEPANSSYTLDGALADWCVWPARALTPPEIQWLAQPQNRLRVPPCRTVFPSAVVPVEASLSESLAVGDSLVAALSALASVSDGASLGDSLAASKTTADVTSDATTLGDIQAAEATLRRALVDGVLAGEQWATRFTRAATITDGSLAGDSFQALVLATIQDALSEGTQAGSAFAAGLLAYGAITEGVRTSDAYAAMVAAVASMADSATLGDVFSIVRAIAGAVLEGALAGDAFVASLTHYVRGPYYVAAGQVHSPGAVIGETFSAGIAAGQTHSAGALVGQVA